MNITHLTEFFHCADADDQVPGGGALLSVVARARIAQKLFAFHATVRRTTTRLLRSLLSQPLPLTRLQQLLLMLFR